MMRAAEHNNAQREGGIGALISGAQCLHRMQSAQSLGSSGKCLLCAAVVFVSTGTV